MATFARTFAALVVFQCCFLVAVVNGYDDDTFDYKDALRKSIMFLEAQRSGKLPPNHRPSWRGDSALDDGSEADPPVDLVGGYYDAGDNVKFGVSMAFTITTLAWSTIAYRRELLAAGELDNIRAAIRWGTDYFLKAAFKKNRLYVQVGDPDQDHECWVRPEVMQTPRTVLMIDENTPGTEIAAETAAALAGAAIVFRHNDHAYSRRLLNRAKLLFEFANTYRGSFIGGCPYYCSFSGYNDELIWSATWLYHATRKPYYLSFIKQQISNDVQEFSWDLKYAGAQVYLTQFYLRGDKSLQMYKEQADFFVCSVLPESPTFKINLTPGGMIHLRDGANSQYVTSTAFILSIYGDILHRHRKSVQCEDKVFNSTHLFAFAKQQMDYLLGKNPEGRSYMVGFGNNFPKNAHHRGASVPVWQSNVTLSCGESFSVWFNVYTPNPNEVTGAIVGGPDSNDHFFDLRWRSIFTEPCIYTNSLAVAALARLTRT